MLSFLGRRVARWREAIGLYAYEPSALELDHIEGRLHLRAVRPTVYGSPAVIIVVRELWRPGRDRLRLAPTVDSHQLERAGWHAQIAHDGPTNAERFDIDRSKPIGAMRHRHPYGSPNEVREPTTIAVPEAWMLHVETVIALEWPQRTKRTSST